MFGIGKKLKMFKGYVRMSIENRRKNVRLKWPARIGPRAVFEDHIRVRENSRIEGRVGRCTYIGNDCNLFCDIGRFCSIAPEVMTIIGRHPLDKHVSTSPATYSKFGQCGKSYHYDSSFAEFKGVGCSEVLIENDVWIGPRVMIVGGVTIHNGAVVLAGAVVTKDVPPYAIVAGVPAKVIRYRFPEDTIRRLLELAWWDKPDEWLERHAERMDDVDAFLRTLAD